MEAVRLAPSVEPDGTFVLDVPRWYAKARCADADPDLFFSTDPEPALAVCATCPVVDACRDYAADQGFTVGIWGGTTPDDRRQQRAA